jgi:prepilin peptidase CpaA
MSLDLLPAAIASVAALIDLRSRRIPNWLTLAAVLAGLAWHTLRDGPTGLSVALAGAALGLALLLPFYMVRGVGAGDVKLLAAIGALVGPQTLVSVAIYGALVGGAISLVLLARSRLQMRGMTAPYGVAIASGVYLSMLLPSVIG